MQQAHFGFHALLAATFFERDGYQALTHGAHLLAFPFPGEHQALRRRDFAIDAADGMDLAGFRTHAESIASDDARIDRRVGNGEPARTEPLLQQLRFDEGVKNFLPRGADGAGNRQIQGVASSHRFLLLGVGGGSSRSAASPSSRSSQKLR